MGASKNFLVSVLVCCIVISTSLPFPDSNSVPSETYINCNDLSLVEKLENAGITFSCFQSASKKVLDSLPIDSSFNSLVPPAKRPSFVEEDKESDPVTDCPEGYTFIAEKNDCVVTDAFKQESKPESYFNQNVESLSSRKCQEGYVFNLDKGECLPDSKIFSVNYKHVIPSNADEEIVTTLKCRSGTVYAPQVDLCLPIKPEAVAQPPELESVEIAFVPHPTKGCPKGSVYSPEIDHCLKIQVPPKSTTPKDDVESVFISNQDAPGIFDATSSKKHGYDDADREVRDVPVDILSKNDTEPAKPKQDKRSASDPTQLSLSPLTHEAIGWDMCKDGEVYVSEIDLCLKP